MKRQITVWEFVRLLVALLVAFIIYVAGNFVADAFLPEIPGSMGMVAYLTVGLFVPAFFAVLIATLIPSWRYRLIAATLMFSGLTLWGLFDLIQITIVTLDIWAFAGYVVRLSAQMTGALLAVYIWKQFKARWQKGAGVNTPTIEPATVMPTTSPIVLGLSVISIPITYITIFTSAFLVLGYSALLLLLLLEMERIPTFLLIAAILAPFVAAWASLRALGGLLFAKPPFTPAQSVTWSERPQLNAMIEEVCRAVETRAPDNVILHIKPTFFVTQQKLRTFDTVLKGRTLAIGMPLLPLLTDDELKAVLAHEFAHFSGRDTFYSVWVAPVYRGLEEAIVRLQQTIAVGGHWAKVVMNYLLIPSLIALIIFYEFFASIDMIISRSREFRADWIAASHYGRDSLINALKKIIQYGNFFSEQQAQINPETASHIQQHYRILTPVEPDALQGYLDKAMNAQENEFDSHPTLATRIGNLPVTANGADANDENGDDGEIDYEYEDVNDEDANNGALQQELGDDIAVLTATYEKMMYELRDYIARVQQSQQA